MTSLLLIAGLVAYIGMQKGHLVWPMLQFHGLIFAVFLVIYNTLPGGFEAHFNVPKSDKKTSFLDMVYFTTMTHASNSVDMYPKTPLARALVSAHIGFTVLSLFHLMTISHSVGRSKIM